MITSDCCGRAPKEFSASLTDSSSLAAEYPAELVTTSINVANEIQKKSIDVANEIQRSVKKYVGIAEQPTVIVGPVIGRVSSTTARILYEIDAEADITAIASCKDSEPVVVKARFQGLGHPKVLEFVGLNPATEYKVKLEGATNDNHLLGHARFSTFVSDVYSEELKVAIVSCNKVYYDCEGNGTKDMWHDLATRIENGEVNAVFHVGDQVYADSDFSLEDDAENLGQDTDLSVRSYAASVRTSFGGDADTLHKDKHSDKSGSAYVQALQLCNEVDSSEWSKLKHGILEMYRAVYRTTWQHYPTAKALALAPNYMVLDDHEITDGWGDGPEDRTCGDPSSTGATEWASARQFVAACGWQVYNEYQASLMGDIYDKAAGKDAFYIETINNVGFVVLELRACKSWMRDEEDPPDSFLGRQQWNALHIALDPGGVLGEVQKLVLCSPVPVAFLSPEMTDTMKHVIADFEGLWGAFRDELLQLMDKLRDWKAASPGREFIIAAGDVHIGIHTQIWHGDEFLGSQITASAICNEKVGRMALAVIEGESFGMNTLVGQYRFEHRYMSDHNNYAVITIPASRDETMVCTSYVENGSHADVLSIPFDMDHKPRNIVSKIHQCTCVIA
jgi:phosphodiesterase/alkaline phosphatase D-like protein